MFPYQPIRELQHAKKLIDGENRNVSLKLNTIIGVVGAAYSSVTIPLSRATLAMKLPLVSYAATNPDLSQHKVYNQHLHLLLIYRVFFTLIVINIVGTHCI